MLYGIRGCSEPATAYLSAITYWVFSCRDLRTTPAKGLDKWSFLGSAIAQAGVKSETVEGYMGRLAEKLKSHTPFLSRWETMIAYEENQRIPLFATRTADGGLTDLVEPLPGSPLPARISPADVLQDLLAQGIRESQIIKLAKPARMGGKPFVVLMHCQVADSIFGYQPVEATEDGTIIDAEAQEAA